MKNHEFSDKITYLDKKLTTKARFTKGNLAKFYNPASFTC